MSITLPPEYVDVNVHSTKGELYLIQVTIYNTDNLFDLCVQQVVDLSPASKVTANKVSSVNTSTSEKKKEKSKETVDLSSVQVLISEIEHGCHSGLLDIVRNCTYVGMADVVFALLQHNTDLYLY
ncbi:hypothetical protein R6Q59_034460 [Mikania micrantha]